MKNGIPQNPHLPKILLDPPRTCFRGAGGFLFSPELDSGSQFFIFDYSFFI